MTPQGVHRRLAAVLATDIVGYSRLMEVDEAGTHARYKALTQDILGPKITQHGGRVVKSTGDGVLAEFASAIEAVQCAIGLQQAMGEWNKGVPGDRRIEFRIGINVGDVIVEDEDIYGDGVNIAARLESFADPGAISISGEVYSQVEGKLDADFEDLGERKVRNIARPIRVYRIRPLANALTPPDRPVQPRPARPLTEQPSIAVLPFDNMSGDRSQDYFSDGLAEDIITGISRLRWLIVIARNSTFVYKGRAVDVTEVSRELGVRYVLEGSVRRHGDRIRITAQLIDATTDAHVWAERYDRDFTDIFEVQDDITASIVGAMWPEVTFAEIDRIKHKRPANLVAWDYYLQAVPMVCQITNEANEKTKDLLAKAIELDPNFVAAHAMMAWCYTLEAIFRWGESGRESFSQAGQWAFKALAIEPADPYANSILSGLYSLGGQHEKAIDAAKLALERDPNLSVARGNLGVAYAFAGRADEALEEFDKALRGSPRDPMRWAWFAGIAHALFSAGKFDDAVAWEKKALQLRPTWYGCYVIMAACYAHLGRTADAKAAVSELLRLVPRFSVRGASKNPLFANPDHAASLLDGLRKAGVPE